MEAASSEGENNRDMMMNQNPLPDASKRPKRQMKTPFQLQVLEKTYSMDMYPSEAIRAELSERLNLTDRQLQMWFCHRRLKDKKESAGTSVMKPHNPSSAGRRGVTESPRNERMTSQHDSERGSGSGSGSGSDSGSGSSQFDHGDEIPMVPRRYYESPKEKMERRIIACVESQLGEPIREDGPILGMDFDEVPPGAFGAPIVPRDQQEKHRHSYESKLYGDYDAKHVKVSTSRHEASTYLYDSPADGSSGKSLAPKHGNGHLPREYGLEGQVPSADLLVQPNDRKRKSDEARIRKEVQFHEKKIRKELEKQDLMRSKREEQMKKEMERQDRERRKEEQRMMSEQQKQEEKFQREEKREMERREKYMQKELLRAERMKQKEELRKEKEAARQKAALEKATARKIAKESMELIEDERLELMELAASSKGLPSLVSLDYETLQNLHSFRDDLCEFPPKSVRLKMPLAIQPWINSEENVGNLLMVWKFCITFADVLGLWPFTLDEFIQAFHDYDSRLLGEIHINIMKLVIKDIEDVVRTPSGGPGTNQYTAFNPEGGHPHIVQGAYMWGFDIRNWQKHLNPSTWPEILRQFALSAGFGPRLKKKGVDQVSTNENDEIKGCEDIVSTLRNGSAVENAVAIMRDKGLSTKRRSGHRLTPGTVKFAAYHVLALEGSKGLNVIELADKIQKSGLRDLTTSKTPEASISVALSRDPILFERIAPSTYNVRSAFRKDPADAESVIAEAKEKIQKCANILAGIQNAVEEERDDDSDSDVEVDPLATPSDTNKNGEVTKIGLSSKNGKEKLIGDAAVQNGISAAGNKPEQGLEIDESKSGEPWVQGLTEGEYSYLSIEERLNALVALIGVANEGNSIRVILEERLDAVSTLKKQMWAEAQLDKRRMREEIVAKYYQSSAFNVVGEGGLSHMSVSENKVDDTSATNLEKGESSVFVEDIHNSIENSSQDLSMVQFTSPAQQNGYTAERSRMQLKSYIGHRAEEMYVYRSLPLGQDRRRNRYWLFVASASYYDPGSGRIFVESTKGHWRLIDTKEAFDALFTSLDTRGIRESHLHIMLQKIEVSFKESVQRNKLAYNISIDGAKDALDVNSNESPSGAICSSNCETQEPSRSFRINLGRGETEQQNLLKRFQDLHIWIWKECLNPTTMRALAYGKKRCLPLLGVCDTCFSTYDAKEDPCPSCRVIQQKVGNQSESNIERRNIVDDTTGINFRDVSPLKIRLIKALLILLEVSVPAEAISSTWTEECRSIWGLKLQNSSSNDDLLQLLTQFERSIKRDYLSKDFETTEELLSGCGTSSRKAAYDFNCTDSVPQLPWIPKTGAAVALRILELDASISYTAEQKAETNDEKKVEAIPFTLRYSYTNDVHKTETLEFDKYGSVERANRDQSTPGSSGYHQVVRNRGGRPRGKSQKGGRNALSTSSRLLVKKGETLADILMKQGVRGQKHLRGRRTVRKRRTEKKVPEETLRDYLDDKTTYKKVIEKPASPVQVEFVNSGFKNVTENVNSGFKNVTENEDGSDSDSDGVNNGDENVYKFQRWGSLNYDDAPARSNEMSEDGGDEIEDEVGYDVEGGENLEVNMVIDDEESDGDRDEDVHRDGYGDGNRNEGFEEIDSDEEDYSD